MVIHVTCKNEEDPMKNKGARVATTFSPFELIRDVMVVLVTCKNEKDLIKNEVARVATTFSPLQLNGSYLLPWKPEF